jgi:hypothetical protein
VTWSDGGHDDSYMRHIKRQGMAVERAIRLHEQRCPCRHTQAEPEAEAEPEAPPVMPFGDLSIPERVLVSIAERLSTSEDESIYSLADEHGYPVELLVRELSAYAGRYRKELRRRAGLRDRRPF